MRGEHCGQALENKFTGSSCAERGISIDLFVQFYAGVRSTAVGFTLDTISTKLVVNSTQAAYRHNQSRVDVSPYIPADSHSGPRVNVVPNDSNRHQIDFSDEAWSNE